MPTISELRTLIKNCSGTITGGNCGVTDSCLSSSCENSYYNSCDYSDDGRYSKFGDTYWFWSASEDVSSEEGYSFWSVDFNDGSVFSLSLYYDSEIGVLDNYARVRCVR